MNLLRTNEQREAKSRVLCTKVKYFAVGGRGQLEGDCYNGEKRGRHVTGSTGKVKRSAKGTRLNPSSRVLLHFRAWNELMLLLPLNLFVPSPHSSLPSSEIKNTFRWTDIKEFSATSEEKGSIVSKRRRPPILVETRPGGNNNSFKGTALSVKTRWEQHSRSLCLSAFAQTSFYSVRNSMFWEKHNPNPYSLP